MTRQEFLDTINNEESLLHFCYEENLGVCDEVYSQEGMDEYLNEHLGDIIDGYNWRDVLSILEGIPTGYDYYIKNEYAWMEFYGVDDDVFEELKDEVLQIMDDGGYWDDEEETIYDDIVSPLEEIIIPFGDDTPDEFEVDTTVSLNDFFVSNAQELQQIIAEAEAS